MIPFNARESWVTMPTVAATGDRPPGVGPSLGAVRDVRRDTSVEEAAGTAAVVVEEEAQKEVPV
ncbi:hypothetical protein GCM10009802_26210 [Streptomyces synnematoformans]|uniref:Uncharacterized protein n=1 Tax=Streptomyces synnematoformans TaxID=415721 RepID=A0ABN2Y6Z1_9ACTN